MWHHNLLYFPVIAAILQYLPILHFIYENKDEGCKKNKQFCSVYLLFSSKIMALTTPNVELSCFLWLLTFCTWILEKISSLLAQEVKQPPVRGCFGSIADAVSFSSASLSPQRFAVGHFFPWMAH